MKTILEEKKKDSTESFNHVNCDGLVGKEKKQKNRKKEQHELQNSLELQRRHGIKKRLEIPL